MQEEGTSRPVSLFIRAILVSQLFPLLIDREKHTASRGCLAELGVKQAWACHSSFFLFIWLVENGLLPLLIL